MTNQSIYNAFERFWQHVVAKIESTSGINVTNAKVGQVLVIKSVDANGNPTKYEGVNIIDGNEVAY